MHFKILGSFPGLGKFYDFFATTGIGVTPHCVLYCFERLYLRLTYALYATCLIDTSRYWHSHRVAIGTDAYINHIFPAFP